MSRRVRYVEISEDCERCMECELCQGYCTNIEVCECCECDNYGNSCNLRFENFKRPELENNGVYRQNGPECGCKRVEFQEEGKMCRISNLKNQVKNKPLRFCKREVSCLMKKLNNIISVFPLSRGCEDTEVIAKPIKAGYRPPSHLKEKVPIIKISTPRINRQNRIR
uniref:Uncharacterized protein n=1 Tax=Theileria annulata TaxID=5874 RepID=A0A3B0MP43_THEAN